jgi:hypothetical protein
MKECQSASDDGRQIDRIEQQSKAEVWISRSCDPVSNATIDIDQPPKNQPSPISSIDMLIDFAELRTRLEYDSRHQTASFEIVMAALFNVCWNTN